MEPCGDSRVACSISISLHGTNACYLQLLRVAGPTPHNAFAFIPQSCLDSCFDHATLAPNQDDTTRSRPDVFRHIPNCEPLATISTCSLTTDLVILEDTHRWYVLGVSMTLRHHRSTLTLFFLAEWAIARLQVEARISRNARSQEPSEVDGASHRKSMVSKIDSETEAAIDDIGKYHCTCQSHHGDLHVTSNGAHYVTAVRSNLLWELRYDDCRSIRKQSESGLIFELMDDSEYRVMGLTVRDEVFTQIIGYSGLAWQVTG